MPSSSAAASPHSHDLNQDQGPPTSGSPTTQQRSSMAPPAQVRTEATKGFLTGVARYGSLSLLAHLILSLPHPMTFAPPPTTTPSSAPNSPSTATSLSSSLSAALRRPLTSLSSAFSPASRVYRGLTPQFKVFVQIAAMTLGGCVWAEKRVGEYREAVRRERRSVAMEEGKRGGNTI